MSHGRHAYNRAKRRGGFDRFRRFVTGAELERLWNERGAIDADEQEDEINDEWYGDGGKQMKIHFSKCDLERMAKILRGYRGQCDDQLFAKRMSKAIASQMRKQEETNQCAS